MGLMGMRPDRAINIGESLGDAAQMIEPAHPRGDRHDAADAGGFRALHDCRDLIGEIRKIQVAMAIDENAHAAASGST